MLPSPLVLPIARAARALVPAVLIGFCATPSLALDWTAAKDELSAIGLDPSFVYDGDLATNAAGGLKRGTAYVGNLHLKLELDGEKLLDQPSLTVYLDGLGVHGGQPSGLAADAQGISNIAAPAQFSLYEAWVQFNSQDGRVSLLAGQYDLNAEFYRLNSADLFLNSSFGMGPEFAQSGRDGPSAFPDTSLGIRIGFKPTENIVLRAAILDGVPVDRPVGTPGLFSRHDGALLVAEAVLLGRPGQAMSAMTLHTLIGRASALSPYDDKIAMGGWYYTADFPDLSSIDAGGTPLRHRGSGGAYFIADKLLYEAGENDGTRVSGFVQAGLGDNRVNRFSSYLGAGVAATGLIPQRPNDELGLAAAIGFGSSHYSRAQALLGVDDDAAEIAIEATYLSQITDWLALQPDLQYVIHPNTDPEIGNAFVFQLQFEVSL